jgi:hypothetical protein
MRRNQDPWCPAPRPAARTVETLDALINGVSLLEPGTQVQLGATMFASIVLARSQMPALLAILTSVGFGYAAKRAYVVVHDVHLAALALQRIEQLETAVSDPDAADSQV